MYCEQTTSSVVDVYWKTKDDKDVLQQEWYKFKTIFTTYNYINTIEWGKEILTGKKTQHIYQNMSSRGKDLHGRKVCTSTIVTTVLRSTIVC